MEGSVKWFNRKKGFGFINGDDGEDYFIHHTSLKQGTFIRDNDRVSFDSVETERGKQAQNVVLLQKGSDIATGEEQPAEEQPAEEVSEEPVEEVKEKKAKKKAKKKSKK